jgi:hypothetical protein
VFAPGRASSPRLQKARRRIAQQRNLSPLLIEVAGLYSYKKPPLAITLFIGKKWQKLEGFQ